MRSHLLSHLKRCLQVAARAKQQQNEPIFDPGRRKAIQHLGLVTAGLAAGSLTQPLLRRYDSVLKPRIAILGAGVAGLHCAYVLQQAGLDATVYEGSSRAGGRMFTLHDRFGKGLHTEAGGEFIDSNHTDMLSLARHFDLPLLDVTTDQDHYESALYYFGNVKYSTPELISGFMPVIDKLSADRKACTDAYDNDFAASLDRISLEQYVNTLPCEDWIKQLLIMAYVGEFGLDGGDQSALNFLSLVGFPVDNNLSLFGDSDERYKIAGGNGRIVYQLAEALGEKVKTAFVVNSIRSKGRGYQIGFDNGQRIEADYVVCTLPFTVLRQIDLRISRMSPEKKRCINELGYGVNNKLLMGVQQRVWRMGSRPVEGYTYDRDIHTGWDNSHMQNNNEGAAGFTVFLGGTPSRNLARDAVMQDKKRAINEAGLNFYLNRLDQIYAGFRKSFTGDQELISWSGNPWTLGSYACYKPGQWFSVSGYEAAPVGRNLLFAGEHCSVLYQGFMNGAAETGRLAAEGILSQVGVIKK